MDKMFGIEIKEYYQLKKRDLKELLKKECDDEYKQQLIKSLIAEKRTANIKIILVSIIVVAIIIVLAIGFGSLFNKIIFGN